MCKMLPTFQGKSLRIYAQYKPQTVWMSQYSHVRSHAFWCLNDCQQRTFELTYRYKSGFELRWQWSRYYKYPPSVKPQINVCQIGILLLVEVPPEWFNCFTALFTPVYKTLHIILIETKNYQVSLPRLSYSLAIAKLITSTSDTCKIASTTNCFYW